MTCPASVSAPIRFILAVFIVGVFAGCSAPGSSNPGPTTTNGEQLDALVSYLKATT